MIENANYPSRFELAPISPLFPLLPAEIEKQILGELDYRSLCRLGRTCSRGSNIVVRADDLWRSLYQERWQDQHKVDVRNWSVLFKERFAADSNWRNRTLKIRHSYNFADTCQGTFFSALSSQNTILLKNRNQALMFHKTRFREGSYFLTEPSARKVDGGKHPRKKRKVSARAYHVLECAGLSNKMSVLGWSDANLEFRLRGTAMRHFSRISAVPKVIGTSERNAIVGCRNGTLAFTSDVKVIEEFQVNVGDITEVGFLNGQDASPQGVYFNNVFGQLYYSDLEAGFHSTRSHGLGVAKSELSADKTMLWVGAKSCGVYLADPIRSALPVRFTREDTGIRCLHAQGNYLAVGTIGGKASLYDIRNSQAPLAVNLHDSMVTQVKTGDGKLFSGSFSGSLKAGFSDATVASFEIVKPTDYAVTSIEIDPLMLFATFADGTIIKIDASPSSNLVSETDNWIRKYTS